MKTRRMVILDEEEWNTVRTALEIEAARNADLDADEDQKKVRQSLQIALMAVNNAIKV